MPLVCAACSFEAPVTSGPNTIYLANVARHPATMSAVGAAVLDFAALESQIRVQTIPTEATESASLAISVLAIVGALADLHLLDTDFLQTAEQTLKSCASVLDGGADSVLPVETSADSWQLQMCSDSAPFPLIVQPRMCVLWKPPGWSVSISQSMQGLRRERSSDLTGKRLMTQWLSNNFGQRYRIATDSTETHGFVHRLDKDTSGALLWAPSYGGYYAAKLQFALGRVSKGYVCICCGHPSWNELPLMLEAPLLELDQGGFSHTVVAGHGQRACTEIKCIGYFTDAEGNEVSLVEIELHTGRTHQIRAHLSSEGHPLVSDHTYGGDVLPWCARMFLHCHRLCLDIGDGPLDAHVPLPTDLCQALQGLTPMDEPAQKLLDKWLKV
ncbi:unnamed protein product [Polarella glacialis]|uniref:Pseudouridine synthase RsuA/RluA-like domain-containing protein n=1 Tax=Polarella glacialis TaxID=89957 RepID=A0A813FK56_POLGL|nr:unnamed protein product [Polarella glacialis]